MPSAFWLMGVDEYELEEAEEMEGRGAAGPRYLAAAFVARARALTASSILA